MPILADTLSKLAHHVLEPAQTILRRKRLADAGLSLPVASTAPRLACKRPQCDGSVQHLLRTAKKYKGMGSRVWPESAKPTASIIELGAYESFATYAAEVSRQSKGNDNRAVKKARRLGYTTRMVHPLAYRASVNAIHGSKTFRSGGPVLSAILSNSDDLVDLRHKATWPPCEEHWQIEWAVFRPTDNGEWMAAHATLLRTGSLVRTETIMGHGDALKDGVVKLLMFDMIEWLMGPDPHVQGLRHFQYGAVEHGVNGLHEWKRRMRFLPMRLALTEAAASATDQAAPGP